MFKWFKNKPNDSGNLSCTLNCIGNTKLFVVYLYVDTNCFDYFVGNRQECEEVCEWWTHKDSPTIYFIKEYTEDYPNDI